MRIAMIGSRGIPAGSGGVERIVETLARHLTERGHEVLAYARSTYLPGRPTPPVGRSIYTPGLGGKYLDATTHTATACLDVLGRAVDVVHIHSPGPALWSWLPALAHRPVVLTVHAPDWQRDKWPGPARAMLRAGLRVGLACAKAVTAVSAPLAEELSARTGRDVHCVPNAIDPPPRPQPDLLQRLGLVPGRYVLHVGRIEPEKRLDVLLEAWPKARLDVPLVVAGNWRQTAYGRSCRQRATSDVQFLGPVVGSALSALMAGAGLVAQPSVLEGASLVLLESALHERCVLCTDMPANRAVLAGHAIYLPADAPAAWADALQQSLSDPSQYSVMGLAAGRHVREHFDPRRQAEAMERIYRRVIHQRS